MESTVVGTAQGGRYRDFRGYGRQLPDPRWPGQARIALNFVMNYEEGSERGILEGDDSTEAGLTESSTSAIGSGIRNLAAESMFEYGSRVGFWRLMRLFERRGLPLTVFGCAMALARNPEAAAAIRELGYDVCCHGWRWIKHWELSEEEERSHIQRAISSLEHTVGTRPLGWYCRYGPSINTRRLLVEEGGFLYDSDAYNDELPYWVRVGDLSQLVIPYSLVNNDGKLVDGTAGTGEAFFAYLRDGFDLLYEEAAEQPRMMSVGMHLRILGHPARAAGLARFLDYVTSKPGVWICRRSEIARHWHGMHPMTTELGPR
jgi:allantoinase